MCSRCSVSTEFDTSGRENSAIFLHLLKSISCSKNIQRGVVLISKCFLVCGVAYVVTVSVERVQRLRLVSLGDAGGWRTIQGEQHLNM